MSSEPLTVVTLGETMAMFAQQGSGAPRTGTTFGFRIGGAESNVAIGLARLGVHATWIGRVGADPFGVEVVRAMRGEGVQVSATVDPTRPTGLMVKDRPTGRHQRVSYYRAGSAGGALQPSDLDEDVLRGASWLHLTGITLAIGAGAAEAALRAARIARDAGARVSFDVNHRPSLWDRTTARERVGQILPFVDLLFAGPEEASLLTGTDAVPAAQVQWLQGLGPGEAVLKLGARGAVARAGSEQAEVAALPIGVVDSVGAGDAFVAGYLAAGRGTLAERLALANRAGAFACLSEGDWEGAGSRKDLELLDRADPVVR